MSIQDAWADALIIQAVADALKVTIQIVVESNQGFGLLVAIEKIDVSLMSHRKLQMLTLKKLNHHVC